MFPKRGHEDSWPRIVKSQTPRGSLLGGIIMKNTLFRFLFVIPMICVLLSAAFVQANAANWYLESYWGGRGTGQGELQDPRALAFGSNNNLYVADYGNARVQQFGADGSFIRAWGASGDADTRFEFLKGLTVDQEGNIYVLDGRHIEKFAADGQYLQRTDEEIFVDGFSLAASSNNNIYTVGGGRVTIYGSDLLEVGSHEVMGCAENSYGGMAIVNDLLYMTDSHCQAVDVYSASGDRLNHWIFSGLASSFSIAESNAELFATSPTERAIRILSTDGIDTGRTIAIPELGGEVVYPLAVTTHDEHVYVLAGDYVLKFSKETAVQETTWTEMKEKYQ